MSTDKTNLAAELLAAAAVMRLWAVRQPQRAATIGCLADLLRRAAGRVAELEGVLRRVCAADYDLENDRGTDAGRDELVAAIDAAGELLRWD